MSEGDGSDDDDEQFEYPSQVGWSRYVDRCSVESRLNKYIEVLVLQLLEHDYSS